MLQTEITVVIPYNKNTLGLVYSLTMLQNQERMKPAKIIIIDTSSDKSGLAIAKQFAYNQVEIVVECAQVQIYEAWNKGIELAGNTNVLIMNDDLIFPINLMEIMNYAVTKQHSLIYVPETVGREHSANTITMKFENKVNKAISFEPVKWMPGFCFLLTPKALEKIGLFDTENYKIWFGDDDYQNRALQWEKDNHQPAITLVRGIFVYHYGGKSYRYKQKETLAQIQKDREHYLKK